MKFEEKINRLVEMYFVSSPFTPIEQSVIPAIECAKLAYTAGLEHERKKSAALIKALSHYTKGAPYIGFDRGEIARQALAAYSADN